MSDRLRDTGNKKGRLKTRLIFLCHHFSAFPKKKLRKIMIFILDFVYKVHLTQARIKSLLNLPSPIFFEKLPGFQGIKKKGKIEK